MSAEHRKGTATTRLVEFLDNAEEDPALLKEALYVATAVDEWGDGYASSEETFRKIYGRCVEAESMIPEAASKMLLEAADLWFGYEADIELETADAIKQQERNRVLFSEYRRN